MDSGPHQPTSSEFAAVHKAVASDALSLSSWPPPRRACFQFVYRLEEAFHRCPRPNLLPRRRQLAGCQISLWGGCCTQPELLSIGQETKESSLFPLEQKKRVVQVGRDLLVPTFLSSSDFQRLMDHVWYLLIPSTSSKTKHHSMVNENLQNYCYLTYRSIEMLTN